MRVGEVFVVALVIAGSSGSPILDWGKKDGNSLLDKVTSIKQTVYEKKREFINGINEKVSRALWIPPWTSTTTEETAVDIPVQHDPVPSETPSIWWWQSTVKPDNPAETPIATTSTVEPPSISTAGVHVTTTAKPSTSTVARIQLDDDRLIFTVADTNELELPMVSMYARSNFIPQEHQLTDSMEYTGPIFGGGPPALPRDNTKRLIVL
uniref:Uncharacterized protein n=1 Tax=Anopheles atroparvus TaxID=41427 RepID=A0AAG5DUX1_ANOAO